MAGVFSFPESASTPTVFEAQGMSPDTAGDAGRVAGADEKAVAVASVRPRRWRLLIAPAAAFLLFFDLARAPQQQWTGRLFLGGIHAYQATLSKVMPVLGVHCRFTPTCSRYAAASIEKYGAARGTARSMVRLLKCGPWTTRGTEDPP